MAAIAKAYVSVLPDFASFGKLLSSGLGKVNAEKEGQNLGAGVTRGVEGETRNIRSNIERGLSGVGAPIGRREGQALSRDLNKAAGAGASGTKRNLDQMLGGFGGSVGQREGKALSSNLAEHAAAGSPGTKGKLASALGGFGAPVGDREGKSLASKLGSTVQGEAGKLKGVGQSIGNSLGVPVGLAFTAALGVIGVASVKAASTFQQEMERIHTQAGVPQAAIKGLGDGILKMTGQVGTSANTLADQMYHVQSTFESTGVSSAKAMDLVRIAAEAAKISGANAVDTQNALDATVISGIAGTMKYTEVMGVLNATVGVGDMKMQDLNEALSTGVMVAMKGYGLSITDVGAALADFGDNNIRGAHAATSLRMAVQAMAKPVKGGEAILKSIGITARQLGTDMAQGGLKKALEDLKSHMDAAGVSSKQTGQFITEAFGKRAGVGLSVLIGTMNNLESKYPALSRAAKNFAGDWATQAKTSKQHSDDLKASIGALEISFGQKLLPSVTSVTTGLTHFIQGMETGRGIGGVFASTMTTIGHIASALRVPLEILAATVAAVWVGSKAVAFISILGQIPGALAAVRGAALLTSGVLMNAVPIARWLAFASAQYAVAAASKVAAAGQWLLNVAMDANPIGIVIVAIGALAAGIVYAYNHSETFRRVIIAMWQDIEAAFSAAVGFIGNAWNTLWGGLTGAVSGAWNAVIGVITGAVNWIYTTLGNMWQWVSNLVSGIGSAITGAVSSIPGGTTVLHALGFASGGLITGSGTGTSDSIPTMLSNGEFVVTAAATAKNLAALQAMNAGTKTGPGGAVVGTAKGSPAAEDAAVVKGLAAVVSTVTQGFKTVNATIVWAAGHIAHAVTSPASPHVAQAVATARATQATHTATRAVGGSITGTHGTLKQVESAIHSLGGHLESLSAFAKASGGSTKTGYYSHGAGKTALNESYLQYAKLQAFAAANGGAARYASGDGKKALMEAFATWEKSGTSLASVHSKYLIASGQAPSVSTPRTSTGYVPHPRQKGAAYVPHPRKKGAAYVPHPRQKGAAYVPHPRISHAAAYVPHPRVSHAAAYVPHPRISHAKAYVPHPRVSHAKPYVRHPRTRSAATIAAAAAGTDGPVLAGLTAPSAAAVAAAAAKIKAPSYAAPTIKAPAAIQPPAVLKASHGGGGNMFGWLKDDWNAAWGSIKAAFDHSMNFIKALWNATWGALKSVFVGHINFFKGLWDTSWGAVKTVFTTVVGGLKIAWDATWGALKSTFNGVLSFIKGDWNAAWGTIKSTFGVVLGFVKGVWNTTWNAVKATTKAVWGEIYGIIATPMHAVQDVLKAGLAFIKWDWDLTWAVIKVAAKIVWDAISVVVKWGINLVKTVVSDSLHFVEGVWNAVWGAISNTAKTIWNGIYNTIFATIHGVEKVIGDVTNAISTAWGAIWSVIGGTVKRLWNDIYNTVFAMIHGVEKIISDVTGAISSTWTGFWKGTSDTTSRTWDAIKGYVSTSLNFIKGVFDRVTGAVKGTWDTFWGAIKGTASTAWDWISSHTKLALDGIKGMFSDAVKAIGGIWNTVTDTVAKPIHAMLHFINTAILKPLDSVTSHFGVHTPPIPGFATGGPVSGAGTATSDSIPAMLSHGEYVVNAEATKRHRKLLDAINTPSGRPLGQTNAKGQEIGGFGGSGLPGDSGVWRQMWAAVQGKVAGISMTSNYRPGSKAAGSNGLDWHASGHAIDMGGSLGAMHNMFNYILGRWPWSTELIHSQENGRQLKNGHPLLYGEPTRSGHFNHVHWAMANAAMLKGAGAGAGGGGGGLLSSVGGFISSIFGDLMKVFLKGPAKLVASHIGKTPEIPNGLLSGILGSLFDAASSKASAADTSSSGFGPSQGAMGPMPTGSAVGRWLPLVDRVLGELHQPKNLDKYILEIIQHESGGDPNSINRTDSNAQAGHPSQGLMQTIPGTFSANAGPYAGMGILNPLANIYAGVHYGISRYGSVANIPGVRSLSHGGPYLPYDQGGLASGSGWLPKVTPRPERVLSPDQTAMFEQAMSGGVSPQQITVAVYLDGQRIDDKIEVAIDGHAVSMARALSNGRTH